jgi:hypothetical protein
MAKTKKKSKAPKELIEVDPILPLPAIPGTLPVIKEGEGAVINLDTTPMYVQLTYRSFFSLWEIAEKRAATEYQHYLGGPMDHIAQMRLETVVAFRNAVLDARELPRIEPFTEERAAKLRRRWFKAQAEALSDAKKSKKGTNGAPEAEKGSASPTAAKETTSDEPMCDASHKIDGKRRKCRRPENHKGKHRDKKDNVW